MARPDEALALMKQGKDPVEIAREMGITVTSVLDYLDRKTGAGQLRRSDIYFSVSRDRRDAPPNRLYAEVVNRYADEASAYGDMYEDLRSIETTLHKLVRERLKEALGDEEKGWWRQGVPEGVRLKCQDRRERDEDPCSDPYGYTDLLDLARILEANWKHFTSILPAALTDNRKQFLSDLGKLNGIRNKVMHPVRGAPPTEDDFEFARQLRNNVGSVSNTA